MHYYEFQVKVVVQEGVAYVYNLPRNTVLADSILCFVGDVPCIVGVEVGGCEPIWCDPCDPCDVCSGDYSFCSPYCEVKGVWLPQTTVLFAPLIADPRQVLNSAALRFNDSAIGKKVGAATFGDDFIFYRWKDVWRWHGDLEVGIEAGIFSVFDLNHANAAYVNSDFYVAGLCNYAFDAYAFRLRLWHLSSHVGDEFLLAHPEFQRKNLSDEGIDFFVSYMLCRAIRLYAGIGDIFDRDRSFPEKPLYIEFGTEIRVFGERDFCENLYCQPFLAMHFRSWQEHDWTLDQTYALGVEWSKLRGVGKKFRIFVELHNGFCCEGQFLRQRSRYVAIRTSYSF